MTTHTPNHKVNHFNPFVNHRQRHQARCPKRMIHHNVPPDLPTYIVVSHRNNWSRVRYGVSSAFRVLPKDLLVKKYDHVRDCLAGVLGLTTGQCEVVLRLLRLWSYYGKVYPKESQITEEPGCSKATFWRTIWILRELELIHVINRYLIRPEAQISNLYRLDRLVQVIARYLAERGTRFAQEWLLPVLKIPGSEFWRSFREIPLLPGGNGETGQ